jgi:hypothetical protein
MAGIGVGGYGSISQEFLDFDMGSSYSHIILLLSTVMNGRLDSGFSGTTTIEHP